MGLKCRCWEDAASSLPQLTPALRQPSSQPAFLPVAAGWLVHIPQVAAMVERPFLPAFLPKKVLVFTVVGLSGVPCPGTRGVRGISRSCWRKQEGPGRNDSRRSPHSSPALPHTHCVLWGHLCVLSLHALSREMGAFIPPPHFKHGGGSSEVTGMKGAVNSEDLTLRLEKALGPGPAGAGAALLPKGPVVVGPCVLAQ